jgi:hypothetical protein
MKANLRARKRDRPSLVYRNGRLLIGWRTSKVLQSDTTSKTITEAWLGQIGPEEAAGDFESAHVAAIGLLRVYVSSDGSDQMYNDVRGSTKLTQPSCVPTTASARALLSRSWERMRDFSYLLPNCVW